jgi:hypothetical protein
MTNELTTDTVEQTKPKAKPSFKRANAETKSETPKQEAEPVQVAQEQQAPVQTPAELNEVRALIQIKDYVGNLINGNFTLPKDQMKDLQKIHLLMDKKIVGVILSDEFKNYVHFEEGEKATKEAAWNNNIKSSLYR